MTVKNVLIVENEEVLGKALRSWLKIIFPGFEIQLIGSGEAAIGLVRMNPPDLILMDIGLPNIDGIEAASRIKILSPEIPIIIVTVHENIEYQKNAKKVGAEAFVPKRRIYKELIPIINDLLEKDARRKNSADLRTGV